MLESHHVSSAIVVTRPELAEKVISNLLVLDGVEVHASRLGKIVVVIEGPNAGVLGEILIKISAMDEVIAAHMVFEQALHKREERDDERTHAT